jgi:hypothetical protein
MAKPRMDQWGNDVSRMLAWRDQLAKKPVSAGEKAIRRRTVNAARGRDADGRALFFESLEPGSRGAVSPLGGLARPAEQAKRR